jgi:site-specific recombinase XerD
MIFPKDLGKMIGDRADELERASAHRLRHTAGSHMADGGVDLRTIRDNLGHASLTTSLYLHAEDDERHRESVPLRKMK